MSILHDRYRQLRPELDLLADEAVLTQAWKKSDTHVRRHNWYSDLLELDCTLVNLPSELQKWREEVLDGNVRPVPMRLVPAPKNGIWYFPPTASDNSAWRFKAESGRDQPELRPLAHLSIRDQTLASAVMLCLADAVETAQGNTDQPTVGDAQQAKVFSYGNRLFCDWTGPGTKQRARFRWGNASVYSKFFQDYKRFLERPADACRGALKSAAPDRRLFVVKLDLSKFYDRIDRNTLLKRLKKLHSDFALKFDPDHARPAKDHFWSRAKQIFSWQWSNDDLDKANLFEPSSHSEGLPDALPQGLVAGGFFANAYMASLDQTIGHKIGTAILPGCGLVDYCRYVDDIRLVISVNEPHFDLASVTRWMNNVLNEYCKGLGQNKCLSVREEKIQMTAWEDFAVQGRTSQYMRGVQAQISVVPDPQSLRQSTAILDHLLTVAEAVQEIPDRGENSLALSRIAVPRMDVRDDTIQRFAAHRLKKVLRLRRNMSPSEVPPPSEQNLAPGDDATLDHEMETVARKLIACWARNPALVSVLRCALDLFPSPELLQPVLEALLSKLRESVSRAQNEAHIAEYVLADLLKAGAVETGMGPEDNYPDHSDIPGYRRDLEKIAHELVNQQGRSWFLRQQAAMFLAASNHPWDIGNDLPELWRYRLLHETLRYRDPSVSERDFLAIAIIAQRIAPAPDRFALWFGKALKMSLPEDGQKLARELRLLNPELLRSVVAAHPEQSWKHWISSLLPRCDSQHDKSINALGKSKCSLVRLICRPDNPFVQEIALLKLADGLLSAFSVNAGADVLGLTLQQIEISCSDWRKIQDPGIRLDAKLLAKTEAQGETDDLPLTALPAWCRPQMGWAFTLGRLLRSAMVGEEDYTSRYYPHRINPRPYSGLRTSWYKRRFGMAIATDGIGEEPTPISPWLNELIFRLLQWPGLDIRSNLINTFAEVKSPADLSPIIKERLRSLQTIYGKLSELPVYPLTTHCASGFDPTRFRVAIVQSLLPGASDFTDSDPTFWTKSTRKKMRAHLATICRLLDQQLRAKSSARNPDNSVGPERLDLIVFPELSVHSDDLRFLDSLSDRTGAAIFAGETFAKHKYHDKAINRAVWILREEIGSGRQIVHVYQGKQHMTQWEGKHGVIGYRPYQLLIEFRPSSGESVRLTGAICYDATDLKLAADLREVSDAFVVTALNKDIHTFDTMAQALQYHMFQPVILANTGEYGGSNAQAPYEDAFRRVITHLHGNGQVSVSVFEVDLQLFRGRHPSAVPPKRKTPPAGYGGRRG